MTCPECDHPPTGSGRPAFVLTLRRWARLGPPRARCSVFEIDGSGLASPCLCGHPFHGS